MINWNTVTTDELLELIPETEDNRWEHKADQLAIDSQKFKIEMGKQVSAFANSGGGYIVLGLNTKREWFPLPDQKNNGISMKDYLAAVVSSAVEYPLQGALIHPVKFTVPRPSPAQFAYVIEVPDSVAAPHQSREEQIYYWRIDGHSKRSPHFHLELLRNRYTKAVLEIEFVQWGMNNVTDHEIGMHLDVEVANTSMESASNWGIHLKQLGEAADWLDNDSRRFLKYGVCIHGGIPKTKKMGDVQIVSAQTPQLVLLPDERKIVRVNITGKVQSNNTENYLALWRRFHVSIRPVSNNHVGGELMLGDWQDEWPKIQDSFMRMLNKAQSKP